METTKPSARVKKQGAWLLVWLWLMLIVNTIAAIANLGAAFAPSPSPLQSVSEITPVWALVVLGLFAIANVVFTVLLLRWKLAGFYGVVAVAVLAFIINMIVGVQIISALFGFVGPVILYFLMKPKWLLFEK